MLVRFDCGCIGFISGNKQFVISRCDGEGDLEISERNLADKTVCHEILTEREQQYFSELGNLVADGYRFRTLRKLLNGGTS